MIKNIAAWNPISLYMVCSYAYYELDESLISDEEFDALCKDLLKNFGKIKLLSGHPHKHFLTKENLEAGTGFSITNWPSRVVSVTEKILNGTYFK